MAQLFVHYFEFGSVVQEILYCTCIKLFLLLALGLTAIFLSRAEQFVQFW